MSTLHITKARCKGCGYCIEVCPRDALAFTGEIGEAGYDTIGVDESLCIQCGSCYRACPDFVFEIY